MYDNDDTYTDRRAKARGDALIAVAIKAPSLTTSETYDHAANFADWILEEDQ